MDNQELYIKQEQQDVSVDSVILGINESLQLLEEKIKGEIENYHNSIKHMLEVQEVRNKTRHEELMQCLHQTMFLLQEKSEYRYRPEGNFFPAMDAFYTNQRSDLKNSVSSMVFKVWSGDRSKKVFVTINKNESAMYKKLISKASEKLLISGHSIVTENDGTLISDDEILFAMKHQTMILLKQNESWTPAGLKYQTKSSSINVEVPIPIPTVNPTTSVNSLEMQTQDNCSEVDVINFDVNNESVWLNFDVKWDQIPKSARISFEKGEKDGSHIRTLVKTVVQQMREIRTRIPVKAFKYVAEKIANKYPRTFKDIDKDGVVIGDGFHSLSSKLEDRNSYLNRSHKSSNSSTDGPALKKRRNVKASCSNWVPVESPNSSTSLKEVLNSYTDKEVNEEFYALLNNAYGEIRRFLDEDEVPTVTDILNEWPILLKPETISWHFHLLTNKNLNDLSKNLSEKSEEILNSGFKKNFQAKITKDMPSFMHALEYISQNFNENLGTWINITGIENLDEASSFPFILEYAEPDSKKEYIIYFERQPVITCTDILQAIELGFALYVIFYLPYPKDIRATMEFIERYFCKIHPNDGSRFIKSKGMKRKVINFIVKLSSL